MQNDSQSDRLSWGDTVFLNLEREGMPLNVASVCIFDGEVSFRSFSQSVESKLPLLPRYLKRVVAPPFNIGLPSWEYDPTFDLRNHLNEVHLKHGSETELKAARLPKRKLALEVPSPRDPLSVLVGGVVDSYSDFVQRALGGLADMVNMAERTSLGGTMPPEALSKLLPEITAFTERLRFNVLYRGPQRFAWSEIPLADVKTIRHRFGASVNDVILALVTSTIRRYVELHGDPVKKRLFRMMVPVNLRGDGGSSAWGNRISLVPVTIPLDIREPRKLLIAVHRRTEFLKQVHAPELVSLAGGLIGIFPSALQSAVGPLASRLPVTPFNMVCTNVPGPQFPLYLLGRRMLHWYPYVPVGGEMSLNCAILSYDGNLGFGFSGDVHAAPDLHRLEKLLQLSFAELQGAAGIHPPGKASQKRRRVPDKFPAASTAVRAPIANPKQVNAVKAAKQQASEENDQATSTPLVA